MARSLNLGGGEARVVRIDSTRFPAFEAARRLDVAGAEGVVTSLREVEVVKNGASDRRAEQR